MVMQLLAQGQTQQMQPADIGFILAFVAVMVLISLGLQVTFCVLLTMIQGRVPMEHRTISIGGIWLLLIPLFNLV